MKVAIVGSREYKNVDQIRNFVKALGKKHPDTIIVSGGARGPDSIATEVGEEIGLSEPIVFLAKWRDEKGNLDKGAGMKRNPLIVKEADVIVAFWDGKSSGTLDTIQHAMSMKKKLVIYFDQPTTEIKINFKK